MGVLFNAFVAFPLAWAAWGSRGLSRGGADDVPLAILFALCMLAVGVFNIAACSQPVSGSAYAPVRWTAMLLNVGLLVVLGIPVLISNREDFSDGWSIVLFLALFAAANFLGISLREPESSQAGVRHPVRSGVSNE